MKKAPHTNQRDGAYGEQLTFLPSPAFSPLTPEKSTLPYLALMEMLKDSITQIVWLKLGYGWRLSATINTLNEMGWQVISERCLVNGRSIAIYRLPNKSRKHFMQLLQKERP
jgi:hypothetical protein